MSNKEFDRLLYRTAPSRIIFIHFYLLAFILAGFSGSLSLGALSLNLPEIAGTDLNTILPLALAAFSLLLFMYTELKRITRRYMVYENRIARREGILSKRIQSMPYNKVERVVFNQSILKRLFGIGDVIINTGEDSIIFEAVRNPGRMESIVSERLSYASSVSSNSQAP